VVGVAGEEIDLDDSGRARVHHHWDRLPDAASPGRWARVVQRGTTGSMLLPRIGWNVFVMNDEGSVDAPTILSRMIDAEHMPPYELPANMTRTTFKTDTSPGGGSSNEIHMEDKAGGQKMFMHASRDMSVMVGDQRNDIVNGNATKKIAQDQKNDVVNTREEHVEKDEVLTIGSNWTEKVAEDYASDVGGDETTKIGGSRNLSTGQNMVQNVNGGRSLRVGAAMIDATLGGIKSVALMHHELVGGAVIKATPMSMTERVGSEVSAGTFMGKLPQKATSLLATPGVAGVVGGLTSKLKKSVGISIQTVGAAKIENTVGNRKLEVSKGFVETTGPAAVTGALITDASGGAFSLTTGTLAVTAAEKITISSKEKVTLQVGTTVLEVAAKTGIRLASKELSLDKAGAIGIKAGETRITAK
jgi:type VI secretion system secreted protein VgrG